MSHPCTQVTALAVSSVGIKFPFVPLLYEVISTIESDISLPLGFRDFFFYVCNMVCLSKFVPARSAGLPGLNGLFTGGEDPGPRSGSLNYIRFPVWAAGVPTSQVRAD